MRSRLGLRSFLRNSSPRIVPLLGLFLFSSSTSSAVIFDDSQRRITNRRWKSNTNSRVFGWNLEITGKGRRMEEVHAIKPAHDLIGTAGIPNKTIHTHITWKVPDVQCKVPVLSVVSRGFKATIHTRITWKLPSGVQLKSFLLRL